MLSLELDEHDVCAFVLIQKRSHKSLDFCMIVWRQLYAVHADALGADDVFFHIVDEETFFRWFVEALACGVIDVGIWFVKPEFVGEVGGRVDFKETGEALFNAFGVVWTEVA
jgi:hypothetical protein